MSRTIFLRNNGAGIRNIGAKMLLPGQSLAFTEDELEPYRGSADLKHAIKTGLISTANGADTVDLVFSPPTPNTAAAPGAASAGEPGAVMVPDPKNPKPQDAAGLAAFIRANPLPAPVGVPAPAPEPTAVPSTPSNS